MGQLKTGGALGGMSRRSGRTPRRLLGLGFFVAVCLLAGFIGMLFTRPGLGLWYQELVKPSFNPPGWLFGPVWTVLYLMMAVSAWLVWMRRGEAAVGGALTAFGLQLALNVLWTVFFFTLHQPALALLEILLLWSMILVTTLMFWRIRPAAGLLLLPYLGWVGFATVLNAALWRLNP